MSAAIFYSETPHGKCQRCGENFSGWALIQPTTDLTCERCGGQVIVIQIKKQWKEDEDER